jgi:hypothetical protein
MPAVSHGLVSDRRFGIGGCPGSDEFFLDLFSYQLKPRFGANRAVLKVFNLRLQLIYPIFGGAKITRELICHGLGALASVVRKVGCLLQHGNDGKPRLLQRIAVDTPLFLRCKFEDLFGSIDRALIDGCRLRVPPRLTAGRRIRLPLVMRRARAPRSMSCDGRRWVFAPEKGFEGPELAKMRSIQLSMANS